MDETQALAVSRHAPTLLGGLAAGSQGAVKVWTPDRRLAFKMLKLAGKRATFAGFLIYLFAHTRIAGVLCGFLMKASLGLFIPALRGLHRPVYVTTDDAGIGVTQWKGSRSVRWDEIGACAVTPLRIDLHTFSHQRIAVHLVGHSNKACQALEAMIIERAELNSQRQRWRTGENESDVRYYSRPGWLVIQDAPLTFRRRLSFIEWSEPEVPSVSLLGIGYRIRRALAVLDPEHDPHGASLRRTLAKRGRRS